MTTNPKPIAKSLHTVTVLVQVARHLMVRLDEQEAMQEAMIILGLFGRDDPYGLEAAALKQIAVQS